MARPLRIQYPGAFYHITCRGIERRSIYRDDKDRSKFIALLTDSLTTYQVVLHAYIMMINHFHLLIQTKKANCSEFMRHFNICYTGWFNYRYQRCGNLYQGRYKALLVDADNYLLEVSRYLHLNSVRSRQLETLEYRARWQHALDNRWSSLAGYVDERRISSIVSYDLILSMVNDRASYRDFIIDGLKRDMKSPFAKITNGIILGEEDFIAQAKRFLRRGSVREQPAYREMVMGAIEPEEVLAIIAQSLGIKKETWNRRGAEGELRGMAAEILYRYCDITQLQIGRYLGEIDYVSVHHLRRRLREKLKVDSELRKRYEKAEAKVKTACAAMQNVKI